MFGRIRAALGSGIFVGLVGAVWLFGGEIWNEIENSRLFGVFYHETIVTHLELSINTQGEVETFSTDFEEVVRHRSEMGRRSVVKSEWKSGDALAVPVEQGVLFLPPRPLRGGVTLQASICGYRYTGGAAVSPADLYAKNNDFAKSLTTLDPCVAGQQNWPAIIHSPTGNEADLAWISVQEFGAMFGPNAELTLTAREGETMPSGFDRNVIVRHFGSWELPYVKLSDPAENYSYFFTPQTFAVDLPHLGGIE